MAALDLSKIVQVNFPEAQYFPQAFPKKQICLHHTVSGPNGARIFEGWAANTDRVATALVVAGDGTIYQGFKSEHWAHHLGLKTSNNTALNQASIGIEVCNWGALTLKDGKYYSAFGQEIPAAEVIDYGQPWRGAQYFQRYTAAQIESTRQLVVFLCDKYGIPKDYNEDIFDINQRALNGEAGIFTHVSYRTDKSDMHPQPELKAMLAGLKAG